MKGQILQIGLVINPLAGIGGPVALKGSDGAATVREARARGGRGNAGERVAMSLQQIPPAVISKLRIFTVAGDMGGDVCARLNLPCEIVFSPPVRETTADDTRAAVSRLQQLGVDLIVFAGGDGTARDVCDVVSPHQPVLGIPAGVKMHSGVFATSPAAAAKILEEMINGGLVSVMRGEVRDIDEEAFRQGVVQAKYYGDMWVPKELRYVQAVKSGGKEVEALAVQEIAADVVENMQDGVTYFIGSGSTTAAITETLGIDGTLLGVDVVKNKSLLLADAQESALYDFAKSGACHIIVTPIGGQGHIFGRGNQQFSARVIDAVGAANITIVATKSKLENLDGRPLIVDTGDVALDTSLTGMIRIVTGYEDAVLYKVSSS